MKVGFSLNIKESDDNIVKLGKHKFFVRLSKEMKKNGIIIDNDEPDVYVRLAGVNKSDANKKSKINILRIDGLISDINIDKKQRNKKLFSFIKESDALIYQSSFCKKSHNEFLNIQDDKKYKIIPNGADPDEFLPRNVKNYFLANCKWRSCKRLKDIVQSFLLALEMGLDSELIITGKPDYIVKHPKIKYVGWQNNDQLKILLSEAIAILHLTWLDWCPNSMIEAIVAKCPVIYTNSGGQKEIGENSGIEIEDSEWDFKPFDNNIIPKINTKEVAFAMIKLKKENIILKDRKDLYISEICKQYLEFFKELL